MKVFSRETILGFALAWALVATFHAVTVHADNSHATTCKTETKGESLWYGTCPGDLIMTGIANYNPGYVLCSELVVTCP